MTPNRTPAEVGRALDERVARAVWPGIDWRSDAAHDDWNAKVPSYFSINNAAAMTLLDTLAGRGWVWQLAYMPSGGDPRDYEVTLWRRDDAEPLVYRPGTTLPLAICHAVLGAVEEEPA